MDSRGIVAIGEANGGLKEDLMIFYYKNLRGILINEETLSPPIVLLKCT